MASRLPRRDFLAGIAVTIVASSGSACSSDDDGGSKTPQGTGGTGGTGGDGGVTYSTDPTDQARVYPQGLASGDPKPDSVILWTRAVPDAGSGSGSVTVIVEVATDQDFAKIIATETVDIDESTDWTVRFKVTALQAFTSYYFRFKAEKVMSITGRTKTAPSPDQDVPVRFAFASCQDFVGRYYYSWQALVEQEQPVDFVLFLGDYVYETNGDPLFQTSTPDRLVEIPDGIVLEVVDGKDVKAAKTLRDYRGLYKTYRSDPWLQKVHSLYPFICIWDDHEFANDCWQDHSTDFDEAQGDEKSPERRHAATRAWYEYQPADVTFDDAALPPADLKLQRILRYGKHVELFMTDQRSFRGDHVIPEAAFGSDKPAGAPDYLTYSTAGKMSPNTPIGSRNFVRKTNTDSGTGSPTGFDEIEALVKPTMLGAEQRGWLIDALKASDATWKFWGNETQLVQMVLDLSPFNVPPLFKGLYYFTVDQWDGYRTERTEILQELSSVKNLVALTGDIHAFYAGELHVDFDKPGPTPIGVEYVTAGISSSPAQEITAGAVLALDPSGAYGLKDLVPKFDEVLTGASPHYKYAKSLIHGVSIVEVDGDKEIRVTFVQIADVKSKTWDGTATRVKFRTASGSNKVEIVA